MGFGLQWIINKITFPKPASSYSLTSHPELFFVKSPKSRPSYPGVPCMLYAIPQGAPVLLVHAHSNGCDIGDMRQTLQSISESLRVHVMSFEFPGYGLHVGSASMRSIDEAASMVLHFLINDLQVNIAQVVWYGRSIGSGPAVRIVHRITQELGRQPGGIIIQCGFANFPEVAGHLFGRVAKQLVSPLWPNEAMVKELRCPVLLIHGRNDTMIPIEQSEKLWSAVSMKEFSHFHTCDCGHNDFNFRRCTLRPIYDFLLGVISSPNFPATNFNIEISASSHTYVHHIGPLRSKIPVYSFRRPELEEWMRRLQKKRDPSTIPVDEEAVMAAIGGASRSDDAPLRPGQRVVVHGLQTGQEMNGKQGILIELDQEEGRWKLRLDGGDRLALKIENLMAVDKDASDAAASAQQEKLEAQSREVRRSAASQPSAADSPPPSSPKKKKGKGTNEPPLIPDFTGLPVIEDVTMALLDPEGMVRTCAHRVGAFLDRLQRQLDRIEGLESKPLEEVIEFVEAEFWACDPLLCIWEEVSVPEGEVVSFRLGPFFVKNNGEHGYDPELGSRSSEHPDLLRVPLWLFCPSPAHFRCLAEWSLLNSERLERNLPGASGFSRSSSCCCVPSPQLRRRKAPAGGSRHSADFSAHPTRGVLATSLAAHFVNWVDKTEEVKLMFSKFVDLYNGPEEALKRVAVPSKPASSGTFMASKGGSAAASSGPPWSPHNFSALARAFLRDGVGPFGSGLVELQLVSPSRPQGDQHGEGDHEIPNICDFDAVAEIVDNPLAHVVPDRDTDWMAAGFLLHYDRLLRGVAGRGEAGATSEEGWGDPLRPSMRKTCLVMNKAIKAFAHAENRERREFQRQRLRPTLRIPQPPSESGAPEPSAPAARDASENGEAAAPNTPVAMERSPVKVSTARC